MYVNLLPSSHRHWDMRRHSWVIKSPADGRNKTGAIKGCCGKETLWKGLCNNKNNYQPTLANINKASNQMQFFIPHYYKPSLTLLG